MEDKEYDCFEFVATIVDGGNISFLIRKVFMGSIIETKFVPYRDFLMFTRMFRDRESALKAMIEHENKIEKFAESVFERSESDVASN